MKRLVVFAEAAGDVEAVPSLIGELLIQLPENLQGQLFLDNKPMKIGAVEKITGNRKPDLLRHLRNAVKRPRLGAVLIVLDGDADRVEGQSFCAVEIARSIARRAAAAGAGTTFSVAVVFLRQEYESLLIVAADQLQGLKSGVTKPPNPEEAPRDAKGWLHKNLLDGYNPTDRQLELPRMVRD